MKRSKPIQPPARSIDTNLNPVAASVATDVGITQAGADKVWSTATRTLSAFGFTVTVGTNNDKTGYTLSGAGIQAIWDALTTAFTTANSIGKKLADWVLGSDNRSLISANAHTGGVTVAAVTGSVGNVTNPVALDFTTALPISPVASTVGAALVKANSLPSGIRKNTALNNFQFFMTDSADHISGKTGLTGFTSQVSIDGGAFAALANSVSEIGNGVYKINLTAGELNGNIITFRFAATGADTRVMTVVTEA